MQAHVLQDVTMSDQPTKLSEADADLIASKLEQRLVEHFHLNVGKGVWALAWKTVVVCIVILAAYGSLKGAWPKFPA